MPFQDDSLNERSSTPPTSSTMHAFRPLPPAAPPEALAAAPPDDVVPLELVAGLDPQAVSATHAAAVSARTRTVPFTIPPQRLVHSTGRAGRAWRRTSRSDELRRRRA